MRQRRLHNSAFGLAVFLIVLAGLRSAVATDGQPILDLGIVSWLDYQKRQLISEIKEVTIENGKVSPTETVVSIYQAVVFLNLDDDSHRLVFLPDVGNKMERAYTSAAIRSGERWGAEFHGFGRLPFHCTIHPEERGEVSVIL
ncbi:MAG: hypothetical protein KJO82_14965 [Gammaproteobacteria bacterium]|nr:hypothetical protein [Gammaproteobacteria bacterium]